jgi:hypothetical protein
MQRLHLAVDFVSKISNCSVWYLFDFVSVVRAICYKHDLAKAGQHSSIQ